MTTTPTLHTQAADMLERYGRIDGVMHCEVSMLIAELRAAAALDELVRENERLGLYDDQKPCWCHQCNPSTGLDRRMILCPICGNKRCPKANDHRNACSGSNEPGQPGSAYAAPAPAQPVDDGKLWSFLRNVMTQGRAISDDHQGKTYEEYSARLDAAAAVRAKELVAMLATAPAVPEGE